jgi:molybdopterin converting factor small subunit
MNRGLKSHEHDKFPFSTKPSAKLKDLIQDLYDRYYDRFEVYLSDKENLSLKRESIVLINGQNMVAHDGLETELSNGDLIVFLIAAVGG